MNTKWQAAVVSVALVAAMTGTAGAEGGGWQRVAAPPVGLEYLLDDVSAVSSDVAYAVGSSETGGGPVLLRWDGARWSSVGDLPATASPTLRAVHARGDRVFAVGQDYVGGLARPLLLARDGKWAKAIGTAPAGAQGRLADVAAVSDTVVWAVGREGSGLVERPVAHRWNGVALERVVLPAEGDYARAEAVSGESGTDVWTVGTEGGLAGARSRGLSWRWNGSGWASVPVPSGGAHQVELTDVVTAGGRVWAVGRADARPLVLSWSGRAWERVAVPAAPATRINAATDDGRGGLWVAGETEDGRDAKPFIARYGAGAWTTASTSDDLSHSAMRGIAEVPGTTTVWAAGRHFRTGSYCSGCRATIAVTG
ncbi:hypothetical protein FHS29_006710 [Saccharothrix tamanrassetensis]|uniref:Uncharacterized protein n=1 Tax=Saccharothrix tamanrassetensis TaxID=1051531 RepID=A0A841CVN9_9PSEU|nr:hypothetical protein [Saccharothrix tamanrassetensis]MBB5960087.1 hypothetical protein [Saccharothrix tamanrassetensis]